MTIAMPLIEHAAGCMYFCCCSPVMSLPDAMAMTPRTST